MKKSENIKLKLMCPFCNKSNLQFRRSVESSFNKKEYKLFLCRTCLIEFFTPLEFEDVYQTESIEGYSDFHKGRSEAPLWTTNILKILQKKKIDMNNKKILEIGSGDGINFTELKKIYQKINSKNYSVIELDKKSIEVCKKRGISKVYDFIFDKKNASKIKGTFDVIIATEVFEHQTNPKEFMDAIFSKLNKGGIVIISIPNRERFFIKQKEIPGDIPPHHFLRFNKSFFKKNFKNIIYCNDYSYEFKTMITSSKIMSKNYLNNSTLWILFTPISFGLRVLGKISGEGIIVIFKK